MTRIAKLKPLLSLTLATMLMWSIGGCDDTNSRVAQRKQAGADIKSASDMLSDISRRGSAPEEEAELRTSYREVIDTTSSRSAEGLAAQQGAKYELTAEAQIGLARVEYHNIQRIETELGNLVTLIHTHLDVALHQYVLKTSNQALDFAETYTRLNTVRRDAQQLLEQGRQRADRIQRSIDDFERRIKTELTAQGRLREAAAEVRESALDTPLDQRQAVLERAREIGREADRHQMNAANLEAELDVVKATLLEAQTEIDHAQRTIVNVQASRSSLEERTRQLRREATRVEGELYGTADQQGTTRKINELINELIGRRENDLAAFYVAAMNATRDALDAAGRAQRLSIDDAGATMLLASAHHLAAEINWRRARGLADIADLLARLVDAADKLRRGDQDRTSLQSVKSEMTQARQAAEEAFENAIKAAQRASSGDEQSSRLLASLRQAQAMLTGETLAPYPAPSDLPYNDSPLGAGAAGDADDLSLSELIRETLRLVEAGSYSAILDQVHPTSTQDRILLGSVGSILTGFENLDRQCVKTYGRGFQAIMNDPEIQQLLASYAETVGATLSGGGGPLPMMTGGFSSATTPAEIQEMIADLQFAYDRSRTTAWIDDDSGQFDDLTFIRIDGQWKYNLDLGDQAATIVAVLNQFISPINQVLSNTISRIDDGTYGDEVTMVQGLVSVAMTVFAAAGQEMMKNMPSPPGATPPAGRGPGPGSGGG